MTHDADEDRTRCDVGLIIVSAELIGTQDSAR